MKIEMTGEGTGPTTRKLSFRGRANTSGQTRVCYRKPLGSVPVLEFSRQGTQRFLRFEVPEARQKIAPGLQPGDPQQPEPASPAGTAERSECPPNDKELCRPGTRHHGLRLYPELKFWAILYRAYGTENCRARLHVPVRKRTFEAAHHEPFRSRALRQQRCSRVGLACPRCYAALPEESNPSSQGQGTRSRVTQPRDRSPTKSLRTLEGFNKDAGPVRHRSGVGMFWRVRRSTGFTRGYSNSTPAVSFKNRGMSHARCAT